MSQHPADANGTGWQEWGRRIAAATAAFAATNAAATANADSDSPPPHPLKARRADSGDSDEGFVVISPSSASASANNTQPPSSLWPAPLARTKSREATESAAGAAQSAAASSSQPPSSMSRNSSFTTLIYPSSRPPLSRNGSSSGGLASFLSSAAAREQSSSSSSLASGAGAALSMPPMYRGATDYDLHAAAPNEQPDQTEHEWDQQQESKYDEEDEDQSYQDDDYDEDYAYDSGDYIPAADVRVTQAPPTKAQVLAREALAARAAAIAAREFVAPSAFALARTLNAKADSALDNKWSASALSSSVAKITPPTAPTTGSAKGTSTRHSATKNLSASAQRRKDRRHPPEQHAQVQQAATTRIGVAATYSGPLAMASVLPPHAHAQAPPPPSNLLVSPSLASSKRRINVSDVSAHLASTVFDPSPNDNSAQRNGAEGNGMGVCERPFMKAPASAIAGLQHAFYVHHRAEIERLFHSESQRTRLVSVAPASYLHTLNCTFFLQHLLDCLNMRGGVAGASGVAHTRLHMRFYHTPSCRCSMGGFLQRCPGLSRADFAWCMNKESPGHDAYICQQECWGTAERVQCEGMTTPNHPLYTAKNVHKMLAKYEPQSFMRASTVPGQPDALVQQKAHTVLVVAEIEGTHSMQHPRMKHHLFPLLVLQYENLDSLSASSASATAGEDEDSNGEDAADPSEIQKLQSRKAAKRALQLERSRAHRAAEQAVDQARAQVAKGRGGFTSMAESYADGDECLAALRSESISPAPSRPAPAVVTAAVDNDEGNDDNNEDEEAARYSEWLSAWNARVAAGELAASSRGADDEDAQDPDRDMTEDETRRYLDYLALAEEHARDLQRAEDEQDQLQLPQQQQRRSYDDEETEENAEDDEAEDDDGGLDSSSRAAALSVPFDDSDVSARGPFLNHHKLPRVSELLRPADAFGPNHNHNARVFMRTWAKNWQVKNMTCNKKSKKNYNQPVKPRSVEQQERLSNSTHLRSVFYLQEEQGQQED